MSSISPSTANVTKPTPVAIVPWLLSNPALPIVRTNRTDLKPTDLAGCPMQSVLTPGRPALPLTLQCLESGKVSTRRRLSKSLAPHARLGTAGSDHYSPTLHADDLPPDHPDDCMRQKNQQRGLQLLLRSAPRDCSATETGIKSSCRTDGLTRSSNIGLSDPAIQKMD